jgi:hypothetical protein
LQHFFAIFIKMAFGKGKVGRKDDKGGTGSMLGKGKMTGGYRRQEGWLEGDMELTWRMTGRGQGVDRKDCREKTGFDGRDWQGTMTELEGWQHR